MHRLRAEMEHEVLLIKRTKPEHVFKRVVVVCRRIYYVNQGQDKSSYFRRRAWHLEDSSNNPILSTELSVKTKFSLPYY